ncbi:glycoside hydrolase family 127 protein [Deinococcus misasensis]|uniref:glycoside hydrolase family 127 protein n=1 Tax=Deinococcus misasensis TaxID=392413 RepID=UPI0005503F23|nr:beta-L-arabinofuranosidase domain-containing protein [Deinococcus misasensis]
MTVKTPLPALTPVSFSQVSLQDRFWSVRQNVNREATLPSQHQKLQEVGAIDALKLEPRARKWPTGNHPVTPQMWWDSDTAKWLEAASYTLSTHPDSALEQQVDDLIQRLADAQQQDGYLNTFFTAIEPENKLRNERDFHELYCSGHLLEAAVAHHQATGKTSFLDIMEKNIRYWMTVYGPNEGQRRGYPGHQVIEMALVKLYRVTGQQAYLNFAKYFVDERGQRPLYFELEAQKRGEDPAGWNPEYSQAHLPVREQTKVVGHAVRAMYLYSAMADLAQETKDSSLLHACETLWDDLTLHRMYVTGGLGSSMTNEGMTFDYDLPNDTAYAETCAAIGLVFWAQRMANLTLDSKYTDVLERALYNGVLSGVSMDGVHYFYDNPLEAHGDKNRWSWHVCPCCPPNVTRLLASLGEYIYGQAREHIAIHLYLGSEASFTFKNQQVKLRQETDFPWDEQVNISLETETPLEFTLSLRIPEYAGNPTLTVNGENVALETVKVYVHLKRVWEKQSQLVLDLPLPVHEVHAHPAVRQDAGLVALQRGPIVYCFERIDVNAPLHTVKLTSGSAFQAKFKPNLLGGVVVLEGEALLEDLEGHSGLYSFQKHNRWISKTVQAVPYALWNHRGRGEMRVWMRS